MVFNRGLLEWRRIESFCMPSVATYAARCAVLARVFGALREQVGEVKQMARRCDQAMRRPIMVGQNASKKAGDEILLSGRRYVVKAVMPDGWYSAEGRGMAPRG